MKEGWEVFKIGEICDIKTGKLDANAASDDGKYPFFTCSKETLRIRTYSYDLECVLIAGNGDLNVKYYNGKFDAYQRTYIISLKHHYSTINTYYLYMFFSKYIEVLRNKSIGGVIKYIKLGDISNAKIPIPPLPEQSRIVEELDLLSNIIEKKRQQLSELDNLAQSIFYDMFGDPVTNEKGWEVKKYREFGKVIGGYAFVSDLFTDDGIPVLKIGNINSGNLKVDKLCFYKYDENLLNYLVYPNDIVISLTGTVGKDDYGNVCVLPDLYNVYYLNQRNAKLETKGVCENLFLKFLFADYKIKAELTKNSRGVRQANISNNDIYNLSLPLPPLSLQQLFAQKIEAIEKQKELIKQSIAETEELFNSRMDYYFS